MAKSIAEDQALRKIAASEFTKEQLNQWLYKAARKGWSKVVEKILEMGGNQDFVFGDRSVLSWASGYGTDDVTTTRILLTANANPNGPGVMEHCGVATLPLLLEAGGKLDGEITHTNPLMSAIVKRTKEDKALALILAGADVNICDKNGATPLMLAAERGRLKVFDALINGGADLYAIDLTGRSVLRRAAESAVGGRLGANATHKRIAMQVLRKLRDCLPAQPEDVILIDLALGDIKELKRKLDHGLNPNLRIYGTIGDLGLPRSEIIGRMIDLGSMDSIIQKGPIPAQTKLDRQAGNSTLLMWAAVSRCTPILKTLLKAGADPDLANKAGVSARTLAQDWNFKDVVELFS